MGIIPEVFSDESEGYITLPALRKFAKEKRRSELKTTVNRPDIIADINTYAGISQENENTVLQWLDSVLKEGIKDIYIKGLDLDEKQYLYLYNDDLLINNLESHIFDPNCRHLKNHYSEDLRCFRYEITDEGERIITLYMGKLISFHSKGSSPRAMPYPLIVEVYVDKGIIVGRGKSKSNMYKFADPFILEAADTTTSEKEILNAIKVVLKILNLSCKKTGDISIDFRNKLYNMLNHYTQTPDEIKRLMEGKKDDIDNITDTIVNQICCIDSLYRKDVLSDVTNMIEKYFSISYSDKNIFTADRDAYPLRISATDDEESKLDQKAVNEDPLQSKAIFFDNKKLLQKSQLCDGVWFRFFRLSSIYCSKAFNVKISIKNDYCCIKFTEYTMEEDIRHVLFSFINS